MKKVVLSVVVDFQSTTTGDCRDCSDSWRKAHGVYHYSVGLKAMSYDSGVKSAFLLKVAKTLFRTGKINYSFL